MAEITTSPIRRCAGRMRNSSPWRSITKSISHELYASPEGIRTVCELPFLKIFVVAISALLVEVHFKLHRSETRCGGVSFDLAETTPPSGPAAARDGKKADFSDRKVWRI
ncbi:MAG: hypothetical protein ACOYNZ_16075 [Rhodoferax sp.]